MATADSSRVQIYYVEESTLGTTPAGAKMQEFRIKGDSLNYGLEYIKSEEIRSDRQIPDLIQTGAEIGGGEDFELSYATFDDFFQAAYFGTWSTSVSLAGIDDLWFSASGASGYPEIITSATDLLVDGGGAIASGMWIKVSGASNAGNNGYFQVLSATTNTLLLAVAGILTDEASGASVTIKNDGMLYNGTTQRSFTFEKYFSDIARYQAFKGCVIGGMNLSFASKAILEGAFEVLGTTGSKFDSATVGTSTTSTNSNEIFNAVSNLTSIQKDGASMTIHLKSFDFELNNNVRGLDEIGTLGYFDIGEGTLDAKASIEAYMDAVDADDFYNDAVDNAAFDMSIRLTDADGNVYIFTFFRGKISSPEVVAGAINEDVMMSADIEWFKGTSMSGKTLQIDRFDA